MRGKNSYLKFLWGLALYAISIHGENVHRLDTPGPRAIAQYVGIPSVSTSTPENQRLLNFSNLMRSERTNEESSFSGLAMELSRRLEESQSCFVENNGRFTNWYEEAVQTTNSLTTQERERWAQQTQGRASALLTPIKTRGARTDQNELALIALRYPGSAAGDEARVLLGRNFLERGHFLEAALVFDSLSPQNERVKMNSAVAWARAGDRVRAQAKWDLIDKSSLLGVLNSERRPDELLNLKRLESLFTDALERGEERGVRGSILSLFEGYISDRESLTNPSWITQCFSGSALRTYLNEHCNAVRKSINRKFQQFAQRTAPESVRDSLSEVLLGSCQTEETQLVVRNVREEEEARELIENLLPQLNHPDATVRTGAIRGIGALGRRAHSAVPRLRQFLNDELRLKEPQSQNETVITALGQIGPAAISTAPDLERILLEGDPNLAPFAASALASMGRESIPFLLRALKKSNKIPTRYFAVKALGEIGEAARVAIPKLINIFGERVGRNQAGFVQLRTVISLQMIGVAAIPPLIMALKDPVKRFWAIQALDRFAEVDQSALPALRDYLNDPDERIRQAAGRAAQNLENNLRPQKQYPN